MLRRIVPLILILPVACSVGPEYKAPPIVDTGEKWLASDVESQQAVPDRWWESLHDPELPRLIEQGLAHNLDIRMAVSRIDEARASLSFAESARLPAIGARGSDTVRRQSKNGPLPIGAIPGIKRDQSIYDVGLDLAWEVDLFGRVRHGVEAARAQIEASRADVAAVRLSVAAEIARTYLSLRAAQQMRLERQASIRALEKIQALTRQRIDAGDLPASAGEQIASRRDSIAATLPVLDGRIHTAALALGTLIGGLPGRELAIATEQGQEAIALPPIPVSERADILRRRPDIVAAERRLAAATANIGIVVAEQFPKLTIGASGGFQSLDTATLFNAGSQTLSITPLISWRIFDGGRIRAEMRASQARQKTAALAYEKSVITAIGEAERALGNYHYFRQALSRQRAAGSGTSAATFQTRRYLDG